MEIAITGAGGFIGSHMARFLMEQGHNVHTFDRRETTDIFRANIVDACATRTIIDLETEVPDFSDMDRVYHFAANMGGVGFFHKHDYTPYITNSRISFNMLEAIQKYEVPRSFVASSACVYPTEWQRTEGIALKFKETDIETGYPDQMYGREKLMLLRLAERHPQEVRCGILHTIYGIGQEAEGQRMKFPTAAAMKAINARTSRKIEMWGNGQQLRSYLYIDDAIRKITTMMESDLYEGAVNIGYEGAVSCIEIQELCTDLLNVLDYDIVFNMAEPSGVLGRDCDNSKFNSLYGYQKDLGYSDGFRKLLNWLDNNGFN